MCLNELHLHHLQRDGVGYTRSQRAPVTVVGDIRSWNQAVYKMKGVEYLLYLYYNAYFRASAYVGHVLPVIQTCDVTTKYL